jgi:uncharacterized protein with PIN domain
MPNTIKCPKCGEEMIQVSTDESVSTKNDKKYTRTIYMCEKDDVWLTLETPKN